MAPWFRSELSQSGVTWISGPMDSSSGALFSPWLGGGSPRFMWLVSMFSPISVRKHLSICPA